MRLLVQYPGVHPVRIDGQEAGQTNSVLRLPPGAHRIEVADPDFEAAANRGYDREAMQPRWDEARARLGRGAATGQG